MGEPGAGHPQFLYFLYRLHEAKMRDMFFMPQGVQYDPLAAPDLFLFGVFDTVGIGDIGKVAKAKAKDGHF